MEPLLIQATEYTPFIEMQEGLITIKGVAILEDSINFFRPVLDWLTQYAENPKEKTIIIIDLILYDSSFSRRLIDFFNILKKIKDKGKKIEIIWHYDPDDNVNLQRGYEFSYAYGLDFTFVPKPKENEN